MNQLERIYRIEVALPAREIHKAGYATGPDYATSLIALMKKHDLYRFDR